MRYGLRIIGCSAPLMPRLHKSLQNGTKTSGAKGSNASRFRRFQQLGTPSWHRSVNPLKIWVISIPEHFPLPRFLAKKEWVSHFDCRQHRSWTVRILQRPNPHLIQRVRQNHYCWKILRRWIHSLFLRRHHIRRFRLQTLQSRIHSDIHSPCS